MAKPIPTACRADLTRLLDHLKTCPTLASCEREPAGETAGRYPSGDWARGLHSTLRAAVHGAHLTLVYLGRRTVTHGDCHSDFPSGAENKNNNGLQTKSVTF